MQPRAWPSTPVLTRWQDQTDQVRELQSRMPTVVNALDGVVEAEAECLAANIDENDHTVFACPDLQFELELLEQAIAKKALFLENQVHLSHPCQTGDTDLAQIVSRNMTNLTPAQLEQFESTFRYFDKDETNTLSLPEMTAALASLGIVYSVRPPPHVLCVPAR
jgi:hypothetical protein